MKALIDKVENSQRITDEEAIELFNSGDVIQLGRAADLSRKTLHPDRVVTYIIDRNVNYTNVCVAYCNFCAFYRPPKHEEGYVLTKDQLYEKLKELVDQDGVQVLLQGGHNPYYKLDWYEDLLKFIKSNFKVHIHGFSAPEITHFSKLNKISLKEVILRLRKAGLDTIPGGGAEILVDRVRFSLAKNRCSSDEWLDVMRTAHQIGMRTTATMVIGHLETIQERVEHLRKLRELQDETRGFTAFIVWTMQTRNTEISDLPTLGSFEYLKTLAISRVYLDNFKNIQSSWVTQGPKIGQLSLRFGANDMGGTMIEENVVSQAGTTFRMTESEIRRLILNIGYTPMRRDCYYNHLKS